MGDKQATKIKAMTIAITLILFALVMFLLVRWAIKKMGDIDW